ncbi:MAG: PIN domain-containing protein [Acidobacteria bacterium]|nr:PIN domain-containing protein [Acidobacteriota bacterium]
MAVVADTGAVYALYDLDDRHHVAVKKAIEREPGPIVIPTAILAELDYLLRQYLGVEAELDFLDDILRGAYTLESLTREDLIRCREVIAKYRGLDLGLADSTVVATAERLGMDRTPGR